MTLAGEGGEPPADGGKGGAEECGGQRRDGLGGVQQVERGVWGEGGGEGEREGKEVSGVGAPVQRSRAGRRREPHRRQMRGARSGGGAHG